MRTPKRPSQPVRSALLVCGLCACQIDYDSLQGEATSSSLSGHPSGPGSQSSNSDANPDSVESDAGTGSTTGTGSKSQDFDPFFCSLSSLKDISLIRAIVDELGPRAFYDGFYSLKRLDLNNSAYVVHSIDGLECAENLQELRIQNHRVTEIFWVSFLPNLKVLDIRGNPAGTWELLQIRNSLQKLQELSWTVSSTEVYRFHQLSESLVHLRELRLEGVGVTAALLPSIFSLPEIRKLGIRFAPNFRVDDLGAYCEHRGFPESSPCAKITDLDLSHMGLLSLDWMTSNHRAPRLTNLRQLNIGYNRVRDLSPLGAYGSQLSHLFAAGNRIESANAIAKVGSISQLILNDNPGIQSLKALSDLTQLVLLHLESCDLTSLQELGDLKHIKSLSLSQNPIDSISPLSGLTSLTHLALQGTKVSDLTPVTTLRSLEEIYLANIPSIVNLTGLENLPKLRTVMAAESGVTDISSIVKWFDLHKKHIELDVSGCPESLCLRRPMASLQQMATENKITLHTTCEPKTHADTAPSYFLASPTLNATPPFRPASDHGSSSDGSPPACPVSLGPGNLCR